MTESAPDESRLERLLHEIAQLRAEVGDLSQRLDALVGPRPDPVVGLNDHPTSNLSARDRHLLTVQIPRELEASLQLFRHFSPTELMPPSGDWALSPLGLLEITRTIQADQPATVVECGSGTSSVWFGMAVSQYGGQVYSLEHDSVYAERTRSMVERHGLHNHVTVLHAPLTEYTREDETLTWYQSDELLATGLTIDLLLIDGPPSSSAGDRAHTLKILADHLSPDAWVFVDDYVRESERQMVDLWRTEYPELRRIPSTTKQLAILRRQEADVAAPPFETETPDNSEPTTSGAS